MWKYITLCVQIGLITINISREIAYKSKWASVGARLFSMLTFLCSGNGLAPNRLHAINQTNRTKMFDGIWLHWLGPGGNEVMDTWYPFTNNSISCFWFKLYEKIKIFCNNPVSGTKITTNFCTCHDSTAVVTCAKICCVHLNYFGFKHGIPMQSELVKRKSFAK